MTKIILNRAVLVISVLMVISQMALLSQGNLTGSWKYVYPGGEMTMQISGTNITMSGISYPYKTEQNNLVVYEEGQSTSYPYTLNGNDLTLVFPNGANITFHREAGSSAGSDPLSKVIQKPSADKSGGSSLLGRWIFQSQEGQLVLEFAEDNRLIFNGEATQYQLKPGIIQAMGDYGWIDYPYTLSQSTLTLTTPEGIQVPFTKTVSTPAGQNTAAAPSTGGGQAWQLRGLLCYWTGSTTSYSSYSRTERLAFDGQGNFAFSNEGGFSSDAGLIHSNSPNVYKGTYSIEGDYVYLYFQTGAVSKTKIHMRQNDGRITELMYKDKLYAAALCE